MWNTFCLSHRPTLNTNNNQRPTAAAANPCHSSGNAMTCWEIARGAGFYNLPSMGATQIKMAILLLAIKAIILYLLIFTTYHLIGDTALLVAGKKDEVKGIQLHIPAILATAFWLINQISC